MCWAALFFAKSKTKLDRVEPEPAGAVGKSAAFSESEAHATSESQADSISFDAPKLPTPKNFLLAGHINQTLALLPKGG